MAMQTIETTRMRQVGKFPIIRQVDLLGKQEDDIDAFMATFDQAVTVSNEEWDVWAKRNRVEERKVEDKDYMSFILFLTIKL